MGIALVRTDGIIIEANQLFRNIIGLAKTSGSGNDENAASFLGRVAESSQGARYRQAGVCKRRKADFRPTGGNSLYRRPSTVDAVRYQSD